MFPSISPIRPEEEFLRETPRRALFQDGGQGYSLLSPDQDLLPYPSAARRDIRLQTNMRIDFASIDDNQVRQVLEWYAKNGDDENWAMLNQMDQEFVAVMLQAQRYAGNNPIIYLDVDESERGLTIHYMVVNVRIDTVQYVVIGFHVDLEDESAAKILIDAIDGVQRHMQRLLSNPSTNRVRIAHQAKEDLQNVFQRVDNQQHQKYAYLDSETANQGVRTTFLHGNATEDIVFSVKKDWEDNWQVVKPETMAYESVTIVFKRPIGYEIQQLSVGDTFVNECVQCGSECYQMEAVTNRLFCNSDCQLKFYEK